MFLSKQKPHTLHMHYRIESYGFGEKQQQKYGKLDLPHEIYINHVRIKKYIKFSFGTGKKYILVEHLW